MGRRGGFAFVLSLWILLEASGARAGSGDVAPRNASDGRVNAGDAALALRMIAGLVPVDLEADVFPLNPPDGPNGDGEVAADDAAAIAQAALGLLAIPDDRGTPAGSFLLAYAPDALYAFDPSDLAAKVADPIALDGLSGVPTALVVADVDASGPEPILDDVRVGAVFYSRPDGTLALVNPEKRVKTAPVVPTPRRVSAEANAVVCLAVPGAAAPGAPPSRIAYLADAEGGDCSGALSWKLVRTGMGTGEAPLAIPAEPLATLPDGGWLGREGGKVRRYDADFGGGTDTGAAYADYAELLGQTADGFYFLNVDGALYAYDAALGTASDTGYDFGLRDGRDPPRQPLALAADADALYFVDNEKGATKPALYRAASAGAPAQIDAPADADLVQEGSAQQMLTAGGRVAYLYLAAGGKTKLVGVAKGGGAGATLAEHSAITLAIGGASLNEAGWVFYGTSDQGQDANFAKAVSISGGAPALAVKNGRWLGASFSRGPSALGRPPGVARFILENPTGGTRHMEAYDAEAPGAAPVDLGAVPAGTFLITFGPGYGPDRLGVLFPQIGPFPGPTEIVYANTGTAGSLFRATNDFLPDLPVGLF